MPSMTPEVPSALSPLIRRVVADNPGLMTGPGTNSYLVGIDEVAVIDPGPDVAKHVDSIVGAAMKDRVRWVLLTHTHPDHWPAADKIRKKTGALVGAFGKFPKTDDVKLDLDLVLDDGDTVDGTEFRLEVLHTPGHAPNHICFLLEEERVLFTGDVILNGMFSVVNPARGGDMALYLQSLEKLKKRRVARIAPGHGDVIDEPRAKIDEYVKHRKGRERQILRALKDGPVRITDIVERVYADTPPELHEWAGKQVHAHLLKLKAEGKVEGGSVKSAWKLA